MISSTLWREMHDAGVETEIVLPLDRPLFTLLTSCVDLRNHRKFTVIDGQITYSGCHKWFDRYRKTLSTPYYVPNATVMNAIQVAAYLGVHVTLNFPERKDTWIVAAASRSFYEAIRRTPT